MEDSHDQEQAAPTPSWKSRLFDLVLKTLTPLVVIVIVAGLYGWRDARVRIKIIEHNPLDSPSRTVSALEDPNTTVATAACRELVRQELVFSWSSVLPTLQRRPEIALECIESRQQDVPERSIEQGVLPHSRVLAYRLAQRWFEQIMTAQNSSEGVCELAGQTRRSLESAGADWRGPLTTCALAASSPEVRTCCVETFEEAELDEVLEEPLIYDEMLARTYLDRLAWIAFEFEQLERLGDEAAVADGEKPDEEQPDEEQPDEAVGGFAGLSSAVVEPMKREQLQDWVLEQGCRALHADADGVTTITAFSPLIESKGCADSDDIPAAMYRKSSWLDACDELYELQRLVSKRPPAEAMCRALQQSVVDQVVTVARMHVGQASEVDLSEAYGEDFTLAPVHATHGSNPVVLGGSPNVGHRSSAGTPMLRGFFSQFMQAGR
jgi:hypothetical protein